MNDSKEFRGLPDEPVFGFYAEAVANPPMLAFAGVEWEPESLKANQAMLVGVASRMGAEYRPEPRSTQRRILSSAASKAWELGDLRIVFVGTKCWDERLFLDEDTDLDWLCTDAVLVCLFSDWPDELACPGLTLNSIPGCARLVHSIVATTDLIGDCLRILRSVEELGSELDLVESDEQYPAAA